MTFGRGDLVILGNYSVFKIGVVLGESTKPGKLRVRAFSTSSKSWSHPFAIDAEKLGRPHYALNMRQRFVLRTAEKERVRGMLEAP